MMVPAGWDGAEDGMESRPLVTYLSLGSVPPAIATLLAILCSAVHSGYLWTKIMCRFSLSNLADLENGPLVVSADWGGAEEADDLKESRPLALVPLAVANLLAVLSSVAHRSYLLTTMSGLLLGSLADPENGPLMAMAD